MNEITTVDEFDNKEIIAFVEIKKPLNKNVWEYEPDFLPANELNVPETEEELAEVLKLWEKQYGTDA